MFSAGEVNRSSEPGAAHRVGRMTGGDAEGADLPRSGFAARLDFRAPVGDAEGVREAIVGLAKLAREKR
jgi:hypothetical protein